MTWHSPLRIATLHDKKVKRIEELERELEQLKTDAAILEAKYETLMAPHRKRLEGATP